MSTPPLLEPISNEAHRLPIKLRAKPPISNANISVNHPLNGKLSRRAIRGAAAAIGRPVINQWAIHFAAIIRGKGSGEITMSSKEPSRQSAWNNLSRARSVESSAITQISPAETAASSCGSGPTPNGNNNAPRTKNITANRASPPSRRAIRRSRAKVDVNPLNAVLPIDRHGGRYFQQMTSSLEH